eukprot:2513387-Prorocentrum_lima.AAC.1
MCIRDSLKTVTFQHCWACAQLKHCTASSTLDRIIAICTYAIIPRAFLSLYVLVLVEYTFCN